jgi:hypothetical protein
MRSTCDIEQQLVTWWSRGRIELPTFRFLGGADSQFSAVKLHPLLAYCDNTAEPLTGTLRPGSAGSNTAADHLAALDAALGTGMAVRPVGDLGRAAGAGDPAAGAGRRRVR